MCYIDVTKYYMYICVYVHVCRCLQFKDAFICILSKGLLSFGVYTRGYSGLYVMFVSPKSIH